MSYCSATELMTGDKKKLHKSYHDKLYGFPLHDDNELFGRLILEINQAGLSWESILKKEPAFTKAYDNFNIEKRAAYGVEDRERLLSDPGIIRNRLKVNAAIETARTVFHLQKEFGAFAKWLELNHSKSKAEWVQLFKKTFLFTGGEIVSEFLMSTGYLPGAHTPDCKIYTEVLKQKPMWANTNILNRGFN